MHDFDALSFQQPTTVEDVESHLSLHQMAQDFRLETAYRQAFTSHCRWYEATARQNQEDLLKMQQEPNLLGWLRGDRSA
jgi:hypothetical protein